VPDVLLLAATERELCGHPGLALGVGPVEAAAAAARALAIDPPAAVLHVGIAGATGFPPGTLVLGVEAVYRDIAAAIPVVDRALPDAALLAALRATAPAAPVVPIVTGAAVSGPRAPREHGLEVEAMEGFGVLRACELAGIPAVEARVVANEIGEENRGLWRIDEALAVLCETLPDLLGAVTATVSSQA
jgi:nucleoside phosphorylase